MKAVDPFYRSKGWRVARAQRLRLDRHTCTAPGCTSKAVVVDHHNPARPRSLEMADLRSLCRSHDNQIKEGRAGERKRGGKLMPIGCDVDGWPAGT